MVQQTPQSTNGEGDEPTHTHPATVDTHERYHASYHHREGMAVGEWESRTSWHTHEHNHSTVTHSHDFSREDEERDHDHEAPVHDHAAPADSPN